MIRWLRRYFERRKARAAALALLRDPDPAEAFAVADQKAATLTDLTGVPHHVARVNGGWRAVEGR